MMMMSWMDGWMNGWMGFGICTHSLADCLAVLENPIHLKQESEPVYQWKPSIIVYHHHQSPPFTGLISYYLLLLLLLAKPCETVHISHSS
ncbi:hypothetical protein K504DRAFT_236196 [Pleomassaria siparia CBS 279.74]|uniref:Uncharacterized protein n=1 Tax=Pleomassaria siparia CBS 279.74 TaxID=1314801 RepID=A0A6G1KD48_9PLEO|nr:hypothetical protein K504DRAFT_236196 [Pleomassaria siparia CBS 279.74]